MALPTCDRPIEGQHLGDEGRLQPPGVSMLRAWPRAGSAKEPAGRCSSTSGSTTSVLANGPRGEWSAARRSVGRQAAAHGQWDVRATRPSDTTYEERTASTRQAHDGREDHHWQRAVRYSPTPGTT